MGKKQRTFMDKIAKGTGARGEECPVCQSVIRNIKIVRAVRNETSGSWRFVETVEKVCKCNEKELLG
ncbi:hypothetical protein DRQ36_02555 [bacterium]|nr:MAG: hypothetical protein DRQ36_02555 [bacterium]